MQQKAAATYNASPVIAIPNGMRHFKMVQNISYVRDFIDYVISSSNSLHYCWNLLQVQRHITCPRRLLLPLLVQKQKVTRSLPWDVTSTSSPDQIGTVCWKATIKAPSTMISRTAVRPMILCDQAFPLISCLVNPFSHRANFTEDMESLDYQLSKVRRAVENTFGRLKARFRFIIKWMECNLCNISSSFSRAACSITYAKN